MFRSCVRQENNVDVGYCSSVAWCRWLSASAITPPGIQRQLFGNLRTKFVEIQRRLASAPHVLKIIPYPDGLAKGNARNGRAKLVENIRSPFCPCAGAATRKEGAYREGLFS